MQAVMSAKMASRPMRAVAAKPARQIARKVVVCKAQQQLTTQKLALPVATALASVMLSGAFFPEEAFAASSGGRAGGSSGFSARKASRQTTTTTSTTVVNNYVTPAPMYAPPVYGGFGFGGFSIMPTFVVPIPFGGFGAIFGLFFTIAMLGAVFNVVRSMQESSSSSSSTTTTTTTTKKYDSWDD